MIKVLFFSPSADIWEHSFPEALVGNMLYDRGADVTMARCRGALGPFCPAGQAAGFTANTSLELQQKLCKRCYKKGRLLDRKLGLKRVEIDDYIDENDTVQIDELVREAEGLRGNLQCADDFNQLQIGGQAVGSTALYELILRHKKNDYDFSDDVWLEYIIFLRLAATVCLISQRLLSDIGPDRVSAYNSLYVAHRAFCLQAIQADITQYFMHAGTNLSRQHGTLMIGQDFTWKYLRDLVNRYKEYAEQAVSKAVIDDVTNHFLCLLSSGSSFVYSTARSKEYFNVREHYGLHTEQKFLVACTSSYDERFAVESVGASKSPESLLFPRILDWVSYLIEIALERPEWFILIRVHPREFPNRRDRIQSEHSRKMKELLKNIPRNVGINWPDDNISLYDLAQEADVFLNAWSSVGKEMALLGLPVVIYSTDIVLYPTVLNFVGTSKKEYLQAIETALNSGWDFECIRSTYRWYALEFSRSCVDLRVSFSPEGRYHRGFVKRLIMKFLRILFYFPQERWDLFRRKQIPQAQEIVCELFVSGKENSERVQQQDHFNADSAEEDMAIRNSLAQLALHLFAANPSDKPSKLQRQFYKAGIIRKEY